MNDPLHAPTLPQPARSRRLDRGWLMRQSAAWVDEARVLLGAPLRRSRLAVRPVPVRIGRRGRSMRVPAL